MNFLLHRVRLTQYFVFLLLFFAGFSLLFDGIELDRPALTLFSVNSFLYGFYISPIINAQRNRIETLHKLVRLEASKLYEVAQYSRRLEADVRATLNKKLATYTSAAYSNRDEQGEKEFENLMDFTIKYKGSADAYKEMLKSLFAVQQNRAEINRLLVTRVYRNEWMIMFILFAITVSFILAIQLPQGSFLNLIPPVLCAGLSMLIVILIKMSTLTHKRAQTIWQPLDSLAQTHFKDINS